MTSRSDRIRQSERELTAALFGDAAAANDVFAVPPAAEDSVARDEAVTAGEKRARAAAWADSDDDVDESEDGAVSAEDSETDVVTEETVSSVTRAAWTDLDDADQRVDLAATARTRNLRRDLAETDVSAAELSKRLRERFNAAHADASWAALPEQRDQDDEHDAETAALLASTAAAMQGTSAQLPSARLVAARARDLNAVAPAQSVVSCVDFHPSGRVALVASTDRSLRVFAVDGEDNAQLQSFQLDDCPVMAARFVDTRRILLTGRRPFFYVLDLDAARAEDSVRQVRIPERSNDKSLEKVVVSPCGQWACFLGRQGAAFLVDTATWRYRGDLRMSAPVVSAAFSRDGRRLFAVTLDGTVYLWNTKRRVCRLSFRDDGCTRAVSLALSPCNTWLAIGADSGFVNLYRVSDLSQESAAQQEKKTKRTKKQKLSLAERLKQRTDFAPKPVHTVQNLVTSVTAMAFSHDGQMLLVASRARKDALRVVHVASGTVFANWPSGKTPLHMVQCLAVSPHSEWLAIGNARGKVLLYRVPHYAARVN